MSNSSNLIGQRLGQYQITALLGRGGMATVYRARQTSIDRDVAIKVIKPDLAEMDDFVKRFEREAKTVASLSNAHILKVFDYGRDQDIVYLVMELLTGGSLADLIAREPIDSETASRMLDQIASALDFAHRQGIIHRDLKPQNVLLDADQDAFLTDFGLAKLMNAGTRLTYGSGTMGTPAYMAPEQWQGGVVDARTDIYALGVLLFEMLSGTLPFDGDTPFRMMHMHVYEQPRTLSDMKMNLPPEVDKVLRRALAKDRDDRFAAAGEMAKAFRAAIWGADSSKMKRPIPSSTAGSPPTDHITLVPILESIPPVVPPTPPTQPPASVPPVPPNPAMPTSSTIPIIDVSQKRSPILPLMIAAIAIIAVLVGVLGGNHGAAGGSATVSATPSNVAVAVIAASSSPTNTITATTTVVPTDTITPTQTTAATSSLIPTVSVVPTETIAPTNTVIPTDTATSTQIPLVNTATALPSSTFASSDTATTAPSDTPVPTMTSTITPMPTETSTPTRPIATAKDRVYTHRAPGDKYQIVNLMQKGDQYPVIGQTTSGSALWYEIILSDQQIAWVFAQNVTVAPADATIPVLPTPMS